MSTTLPAGRLLLLAAALLAACTEASTGTPAAGVADTLAVRVDSLLISVDSLNYTVEIGYPQIAGASASVSAAMVARVNAAIRDSVAADADGFRPAEAPPAGERDAPQYTAEVSGSTGDAMLRGDVFSALLEVYAFTGGAHGNTYYRPLNVDLRTGTAISLGDVFQAGTPWADTLSAHAGRALLARLREGDPTATAASAAETFYTEGYDAAAMRHATFALGTDSLIVQFAPYEVAYYAFGAPGFTVAYRDLEAFLVPDGPVARIRGDRG